MRKVQTIAVIVGLLLSLAASAQNKETAKGTNKIEPLPRDLEIQLALSALPPPVLRTYFNPEESDNVATINFPHVMYYAPDISNEDIGGGKLGGMDPFVILHGHHGYMIQPFGVTERAAITKEYEEMLARLCR